MWATIGRCAVWLLAVAASTAVLAIIALYWPDIYQFIVRGGVSLGLYRLIFRPDRSP